MFNSYGRAKRSRVLSVDRLEVKAAKSFSSYLTLQEFYEIVLPLYTAETPNKGLLKLWRNGSTFGQTLYLFTLYLSTHVGENSVKYYFVLKNSHTTLIGLFENRRRPP